MKKNAALVQRVVKIADKVRVIQRQVTQPVVENLSPDEYNDLLGALHAIKDHANNTIENIRRWK